MVEPCEDTTAAPAKRATRAASRSTRATAAANAEELEDTAAAQPKRAARATRTASQGRTTRASASVVSTAVSDVEDDGDSAPAPRRTRGSVTGAADSSGGSKAAAAGKKGTKKGGKRTQAGPLGVENMDPVVAAIKSSKFLPAMTPVREDAPLQAKQEEAAPAKGASLDTTMRSVCIPGMGV